MIFRLHNECFISLNHLHYSSLRILWISLLFSMLTCINAKCKSVIYKFWINFRNCKIEVSCQILEISARYMAEILPIRRKTLFSQSINQSINQSISDLSKIA